ncbi:MAG: hypothetical protein JWN60_1231 [Acidobacteria bacterium]|jgi:hypothetical protein|nr:hypothetical protein [Acidobacteriota bacterium]
MKKTLPIIFAFIIFSTVSFGQKGVDPQTRRIRQESVKTNTGNNDNATARSFDWGKGKTKTREMLANPYRLNSRRDVLIGNIISTLKERKILIDDAASRTNDGIIITQPFVFAKGAVISQNEINRYAVLQASDTTWTRGQYTLTIEVQSIDGIQNNVSVTAKVEGRSGNGLTTEWTTLQSSGIAEDEFLSKLIETVTGNSPDAPQVINP